jgi:hypothetical protein
MKVPSMKEFRALSELVEKMQLDIIDLRRGQSEWVPLKEAARLAGRSESWFEKRNRKDDFPIAISPCGKNNKRVFFSRADCIAFARKHAIIPPLS